MGTWTRRAGILLLAAAAGVAAGCGEKERHGPGSAEKPTVTGVEVVTAGSASRERFAEVVGTVRARTIAAVAPQVMGRITAIPVAEGIRVKQGAILATIDDTAVRAQLAGAEAMVAEEEAGREEVERVIAQAEAGRALAEKTYDRFRKLHAEKVVTAQEFDEVEAKKTVAVKEHERTLDRREQVVAKIAQAKAQAEAARTMLSYTRVTAPFSGTVTEKKADVGSMAVPGVPIITVEETGR
ncbi:MAG TPA: biotin/lipoyl-binding protein, partial [Candidatus Deferrimicrobiaceae bacterium]|nr:biotin/lipoyl-binding protein [Candidatus Deferrimicrobiaceae bacterium]